MDNSGPLVPFGIAIIVIVGLFIAVPFLRGKSELLNAWNTLLLGVVIFAGIGSLEVKYVPTLGWEQVQWFQPNVKEVRWYMFATSAFIITLLAAYYLNWPAKRFAARRFQKWPPNNAAVAFYVIGFCVALIVASIVLKNVTFVGRVMFELAIAGVPAAGVFSFALWYRNRLNIAWMLLFVGVLASTALYAMYVSAGRRLLLSVVLGPILYLYWNQIRYWKPLRVISAVSIAAVVILAVSVFYASFRWYDFAAREKRTVGGLVQKMREAGHKEDAFALFLKNRLTYFSQNNGHLALLTQRYISQGSLTPIPLNTLRFLLTYPVPHNLWPGKPEVIGLTITRDVARVPTNWGLGIAGQGAFEGGIPALMLYAVLLAFWIRILDEPLRCQPSNPFLICIHAAVLPHVVSICRGDMGIMMIESIEGVLFVFILGLTCRAIFGTQHWGLPVPYRQPLAQYGVSS